MLKPAILYKDIIERKAYEIMYTDDYFYYIGYAHSCVPIEVKPQEGVYQWAICDEDNIIGFISYCLNAYTNSVDRFGLISFDKGNSVLASDVIQLLEKLISEHRRIEWRCIEGNPVSKAYDHFCKRHNGYKAILHKCVIDDFGKYRDTYIYEIINDKTI